MKLFTSNNGVSRPDLTKGTSTNGPRPLDVIQSQRTGYAHTCGLRDGWNVELIVDNTKYGENLSCGGSPFHHISMSGTVDDNSQNAASSN